MLQRYLKAKKRRQQQHQQSPLLHRRQKQHQQSSWLHRCHQQLLGSQRNNGLRTFLSLVTCFISRRKNLRTMNSERRKKRHILSRKINLLYIRVFITTRRVVEHFSMYVYEHTTKIASPATILRHDGVLKNIPTGKMKFVREEVSSVTIIEGS